MCGGESNPWDSSLSFHHSESGFNCSFFILYRLGVDADENPEDLSFEVKTPYCQYSVIHISSALFIAVVFVLFGIDFNPHHSATTLFCSFAASESFKKCQCHASPASIYRNAYEI